MSGQRRKKLKRRSVKKSREKLLRSADRRLSSSAKPNREIYYLNRRSVMKSKERLLRRKGKNKRSTNARLSSANRRLSSCAKPNREIYYWPSRESRL